MLSHSSCHSSLTFFIPPIDRVWGVGHWAVITSLLLLVFSSPSLLLLCTPLFRVLELVPGPWGGHGWAILAHPIHPIHSYHPIPIYSCTHTHKQTTKSTAWITCFVHKERERYMNENNSNNSTVNGEWKGVLPPVDHYYFVYLFNSWTSPYSYAAPLPLFFLFISKVVYTMSQCPRYFIVE